MQRTYEVEVGGKTLTLQTGALAQQANGSVVVRYGDSVVLVTATMSRSKREGVDFLPLTVDYEERMYAAGKIPGSFFRREGRPSQDAILTCRLTDRPLRPRFPKGLRNEIQVIATVLSVDQENPPDIIALIGASASLSISDIPFDGPLAATRVGYVDGEFIINPTFQQVAEGRLDLVVAGSKTEVVMVEAGVDELSEAQVLEAVRRGQEANQLSIVVQERMAQEAGVAKADWEPTVTVDPDMERQVEEMAGAGVAAVIDQGGAKGERNADLTRLEDEAKERFGEKHGIAAVAKAFDSLVQKVVRSKVVEEHRRPDGRGLTEIRPISSSAGVLPRTHGSGLFERGQTQVLSVATLGSMSLEQRLDTLSPEDTKRYMHHYNFPPYSVGEVRRIGGPGRREIGHGALAERALLPVLPSVEEFPYAIRVVSDVLGSNGSTSMASVCGSTLALMDAGVPVKKAVAGVAMGLMAGEGGRYAILTDIQGIEDFMGDMDFKVAGTAEGITALQMDIKVQGITEQTMREALDQAHEARMFILEKMRETIAAPRPDLSPYAPRMTRIQIPVEKIGAVIGPGGKTIRSIIEETGVSIDVDNDGSVTIGSVDGEASRRAIAIIEGLTKDPEVGQKYSGKVTRLMNFGAFVEILPGKEGLVHISELAEHHVPSVEDEVKVGDEVEVMVTEIDRMGRVNLSRRAVLQGLEPGEVAGGNGARRQPEESAARGPSRGPGRGYDRDRRPSGGGRPGVRDRGGPPRGGPPSGDSGRPRR